MQDKNLASFISVELAVPLKNDSGNLWNKISRTNSGSYIPT